MILIMYTPKTKPKKKLYTLLHSMNGGFIFFLPRQAVFSLTFTFQVYGAKKENILVMFPCTGNKVEMSVEIEGKQNT